MHGKVSEEVTSAVTKLQDICNDTLTTTQEMSESFSALYVEVEELESDLKGFKFE